VNGKIYKPRWLTYDELRVASEEILAQYHPEGTIPIPIEEIVEFGLSMDVIPMDGLKDEGP